jgi:hypothetical protein
VVCLDVSAARHFFRVEKSATPSVADFRSNRAKGRTIPSHLPPELHRLWNGLSFYDTFEAALTKAKESPGLGTYVSELVIPTDGTIRWERTTRDPGHHTLWGEPEDLHRCVVHVSPCRDAPEE